jgi:serine/threonine-protein kinase
MTSDIRDRLQAALSAAYTLERELGGGGMSRVFVARDQALGREVVVKVVAPELREGLSADRFAREVKVAARLQHANIVPLLSAGDANGMPYYTMPFVRGESLRSRLSSGARIPIADAVHILRDVARALAYAHAEGVVHRDIKPENVLLSGGAAVVADFGIAKALDASRTIDGSGSPNASATLTQAGLAIGTPAYIAPEQAAGDPTTDHRADIYSWGVVAWELIAGRHPFAQHTTPQALLAAHLRDTPESLRTTRVDVPTGLSELVARCLAKEPTARPASASELLAALDQVATPDPAAAASPTAPGSRNGRRAAALLISMLGIGAFVLWISTRGTGGDGASGPGVKSLVVLPFESQGGDTANAYFGEGMADEVATALAKVPGLQLASRNSANALRERRASPQEIGRSLGVGAVLQGTIRRAGSRMRVSAELTNATSGIVLWTDSYERELQDVFAVQDDIAREIVNALRITLGNEGSTQAPSAGRGTANLAAYDDYLRGIYFYQRRGLAVPKAVEAFSAAIARDSSFARAWAGLGIALTAMTIYTNTPAQDVLPRALQAAERAAQLDPSLAEAYLAMGNAHLYGFRWAEAEEAYRRSIARDSTLALSRLWYGRFLAAHGRIDEALEQLQRANTLDPLSATNPGSLGAALATAGRSDEAVTVARRAFEMDTTLLVAQTAYVFALVGANRMAEARAEGERILRSATDISSIGIAAYAIGRSGDTVRARDLIRGLQQRQAEWRGPTALIRGYAGLRDSAAMLDALESAMASGERFAQNTWLADPIFDPVRESARFVAIARRLGIDPSRLTPEALRRYR